MNTRLQYPYTPQLDLQLHIDQKITSLTSPGTSRRRRRWARRNPFIDSTRERLRTADKNGKKIPQGTSYDRSSRAVPAVTQACVRAPLWPPSCLLNVDTNRAGDRSQHQTSAGTEPLINKSNGTVTALGTEPPHAGAAAAPARPALGTVHLAGKNKPKYCSV